MGALVLHRETTSVISWRQVDKKCCKQLFFLPSIHSAQCLLSPAAPQGEPELEDHYMAAPKPAVPTSAWGLPACFNTWNGRAHAPVGGMSWRPRHLQWLWLDWELRDSKRADQLLEATAGYRQRRETLPGSYLRRDALVLCFRWSP